MYTTIADLAQELSEEHLDTIYERISSVPIENYQVPIAALPTILTYVNTYVEKCTSGQ